MSREKRLSVSSKAKMATARARNIYEDDDAGKMVFLPEIDNPSKQTSFSRGKYIVYIDLTPYSLLHFFLARLI